MLTFMLAVDDRQMVIDDWKWIAIDRVILIERNSPLLRIKVSGAQETWPLRDGITIDLGGSAADPMRNMPHENIKPVDAHAAGFCVCQALDSTCKARPRLALILK